MRTEKVIIEKWKQDGYIRRYVSLEDAANELQISVSHTRIIANKANALVKLGNLPRVNMIALYDYIDAKCGDKNNINPMQPEKSI